MPDTLKITLAQHNQSVGDIAGNAAQVLAARERARSSDLIVFPEMQLIGYPPEDLVLKPAVVERAAAELDRLAQASAAPGPAMLVGSAFVLDGALHNGVALLDQGRVMGVRLKHELPNYGTFDELRLFQPGPLPEPLVVRGAMVGVPISEDIWRPEVSRHLANFGAEVLVCINGSPYEINKEALRIAGVAKRRAVDTGLPLAYLNRVGGQDELVFDGASFVVNGDGALAVQMRDWEAQEAETRWTKTARGWRCDRGEQRALASHPEDIYCAIVLALRDYVDRSGFQGVVVGLDESIGGALCAAIAVDALGHERVQALIPFANAGGRAVAAALGCGVSLLPDDAVARASSALGIPEAGLAGRVQGAALAALAERSDAMPLCTRNKTEFALGEPGNFAGVPGGYAPLKDAYVTTVEALASWRSACRPRIGVGPRTLPDIGAGPVATDVSMPPEPLLDAILSGLVEEDRSVEQLVADGHDRDIVRRVEQALYRAEGARRQSPPGVKLTARNFGRDRRYPLTHAFRSG